MSYGNIKGQPRNEVVLLCGIVEDYRTFVDDFKSVVEFVEWLEEENLRKNQTKNC